MNKNNKAIALLVVFIAFAVVVSYVINLKVVRSAMSEERVIKVELQEAQQPASTVIEGPYTVIINHSAISYINKLEIPEGIEAIKWTDVNGVKVIDVAMGDTFVRYVEGHIEGPQLALYAPYLYVEEAY